jgi:hypothetical protein
MTLAVCTFPFFSNSDADCFLILISDIPDNLKANILTKSDWPRDLEGAKEGGEGSSRVRLMRLQVLFIGLVLLTPETPGSHDGTIGGKCLIWYPGSCLALRPIPFFNP